MATKKQTEETLFFHNPWWTRDSVPEELLEKFKRPAFAKLLSHLLLDRILIIKGPRRVGKTSLSYQMIDHLIRNGTPPKNIFFLSFDDPKARGDLDETFKIYEGILGKALVSSEKIYCFLDEVHFLPQWEFFVKKYFDKKYPIKFIVSGSAATLIKKSSESLAGRTIEETILPFSFFEFLLYKFKDEKLLKELTKHHRQNKLGKLPAAFSFPLEQNVKILFKEYQEKGGFPHIFNIKKKLLWHKLLYEDVIEKVVYRDLAELYEIRQPQALERLLLYASGISAQLLNVSNIANSINLSREYTEKYLGYLKNAYLLFTLKKYARSVEKQIRGLEKIHLIDPGLFNILEKSEEGYMLESLLASHLHRFQGEKLFYWRDNYEVDLVYKNNQVIIPIEVKVSDNIKKSDLGGLLNFMEKYRLPSGLVANSDRLETIGLGKQSIHLIPCWQLAALL